MNGQPASPSARKGLQLGSSNDTRLCPHQRARVLRRQRGLLCQSCKTWFVRGAHRKPRPPQGRWQSCLRVVAFDARSYQNSLLAPAFGTRSRCPTHPARPPSASVTRAALTRAPQPQVSRGVGWLPPRHDGARPPVPTMREPSVLSVCGWGFAPCTAHPCVGSALDSFTRVLCSAVSGRAAH